MKKLEGNVANCKTKEFTLWVIPFFNHWYGLEIYTEKPDIDRWGMDTKKQNPIETSCQAFFSYIGSKAKFEKFDYKHYQKKFKDDWDGGLMAEMIEVKAVMLVDRNGDIIYP